MQRSLPPSGASGAGSEGRFDSSCARNEDLPGQVSSSRTDLAANPKHHGGVARGQRRPERVRTWSRRTRRTRPLRRPWLPVATSPRCKRPKRVNRPGPLRPRNGNRPQGRSSARRVPSCHSRLFSPLSRERHRPGAGGTLDRNTATTSGIYRGICTAGLIGSSPFPPLGVDAPKCARRMMSETSNHVPLRTVSQTPSIVNG